jgi:hypothetical protein
VPAAPSDGGAAGKRYVSMARLSDVFRERLISRDVWPPRSPDFIPSEFYLCEAMKMEFYGFAVVPVI